MSFLNAVQSKAQAIDNTLKIAPTVSVTAVQPTKVTPNNYSTTRTLLDVPYMDRHDAKRLGAWWDPAIKKWYVPAGNDVLPFERWIPRNSTAQPAQPAVVAESSDNDPYARYKQQVTALLEYMKLDSADLQLLAIDTLYKKVFTNPNK